MSSYDKYFSEKNKTHMFALVKDIIIKETAYDISKDPHYHNMFQNKRLDFTDFVIKNNI